MEHTALKICVGLVEGLEATLARKSFIPQLLDWCALKDQSDHGHQVHNDSRDAYYVKKPWSSAVTAPYLVEEADDREFPKDSSNNRSKLADPGHG